LIVIYSKNSHLYSGFLFYHNILRRVNHDADKRQNPLDDREFQGGKQSKASLIESFVNRDALQLQREISIFQDVFLAIVHFKESRLNAVLERKEAGLPIGRMIGYLVVVFLRFIRVIFEPKGVQIPFCIAKFEERIIVNLNFEIDESTVTLSKTHFNFGNKIR
jgi:hypothetical protein